MKCTIFIDWELINMIPMTILMILNKKLIFMHLFLHLTTLLILTIDLLQFIRFDGRN